MYFNSLLKYKIIIISKILLQIFTSTMPSSMYLQTNGMDILMLIKWLRKQLIHFSKQFKNFYII